MPAGEHYILHTKIILKNLHLFKYEQYQKTHITLTDGFTRMPWISTTCMHVKKYQFIFISLFFTHSLL